MKSEWKATEQAALARRLLRGVDSGILSTMSVELPGYPFGSVTPYAMTHEGRLAVYVSEIAQHTRNMRADPKVCLTVTEERGAGNQQAVGRVTVVGDACEASAERAADHEDAVLERYFALYPEARAYAGTHDFRIFLLEPRRVRFIGGFGQIFWVEREDWIVPTPAWSGSEKGILDHMNTDHANAVRDIARSQMESDVQSAELVALDPEGFHIRTESTLLYVPFPGACMTNEAVRAGMIHLARACAPAS